MVVQPGQATAPAGLRHTPPPKRRRRTRGFVQVASATASERLRLNAFGHAYLLVGAGIALVLIYLSMAAQATASSYQITQLQQEQRQLMAEQDQLRYQEATLHAPAQVAQQAAQSGMQRLPPSTYINEPVIGIDITAPIGAPPTDSTPLWAQAIAVVITKLGVARDAMAASGK